MIAESQKGELFVEIQCEELPARFLKPAMDGLVAAVKGLLDGLEVGAIRAYGTPRRVAVVVDGVPAERPKVERVVTGPPADRAFDADGKPTPAAVGFAKGKGLGADDLIVVDGPKGKVIAVKVTEGGKRTAERVAEGLGAAILGIAFPKSMTWGRGGVRWGRPFHRVNVLLHGEVVPGECGGIKFGNTTVGHRLERDKFFQFGSSEAWLRGLRSRGVEPDPARRRETILGMIAEANERHGGDNTIDAELLDEVVNLVEAPTLVVGEFDEALLELPPKLLVLSMKQNQRYFPILSKGALTRRFITISNNPWGDPATVARGNANVLKARFDDARFFFAEDKKSSLDANTEGLQRMRWIRGLGTMADKQERVARLGERLADRFGADPATVGRAGRLAKADLVSKMVGEFPDLQGHMGRLYAAAQGEPADVAVAIEEHYAPKNAGDAVAASPAGRALAVADRLDTLVGCFGIGIVPSSGGDPQGLRRAMAGVSATIVEAGVRQDLRALFGEAVDAFHAAATGWSGFEEWTKKRGEGPVANGRDALADELVEFALGRFKASEVADGTTADVVDAVLAARGSGPVELRELGDKVAALRQRAGNPDFARFMEKLYKRALNITKGKAWPYPTEFTDDAERALADALDRAQADVTRALDSRDYVGALDRMLELEAPVAALFDAGMVDHPDPAVKAVRMGLLIRALQIFSSLADFSRISTR